MCHTSTIYHISNAHSSHHTGWRIVKSFSFKAGSRSPCSSPHFWQKLPLTPETRPASWTPSNTAPTPPELIQKIPTAHPLLSTISQPSPQPFHSIRGQVRMLIWRTDQNLECIRNQLRENQAEAPNATRSHVCQHMNPKGPPARSEDTLIHNQNFSLKLGQQLPARPKAHHKRGKSRW